MTYTVSSGTLNPTQLYHIAAWSSLDEVIFAAVLLAVIGRLYDQSGVMLLSALRPASVWLNLV